MVRTVGPKPRNEFTLDPAEAWRRGRRLDAMLAGVLPRRPHGVFRGTHESLNRLDEERQVEIARRLNPVPQKAPERPHGTDAGASDAA
jgi:hypothetical protein